MRTSLGKLVVSVIPLALATAGGNIVASLTPVAAQSAAWIPVAAEFTEYDAAGNAVMHGRYLRARDGSERRETWLPGRPSRRVISIHNNETHRFYVHRSSHADGEWTSQPMDALPKELALGQTAGGALRLSDSRETRLMFGYTAVATRSGDRTIWKVPELDFLTVLEELPGGGRTVTEKLQVSQELATNLFLPPPGDTVRVSEEKGGRTVTSWSDYQAARGAAAPRP